MLFLMVFKIKIKTKINESEKGVKKKQEKYFTLLGIECCESLPYLDPSQKVDSYRIRIYEEKSPTQRNWMFFPELRIPS
jgi:hypothetical protein